MKKPQKTTLAILLLLSATTATYAQTNVGGFPTFADETWTLAGSPYNVVGGISIRAGATLTIEPGVEVRMNPDIDFVVGLDGANTGTLIARGTESQPIIFTSATDATPGAWRQIRFTDFASDANFDEETGEYLSGSIMEWCTVEFAGAAGFNTGAVTVEASAPYFLNSIFRQNSRSGIWADLGELETLRIEGCTFNNNSSSSGGGLMISDGENHRIIACEFRMNTAEGSKGGGAYIINAPGALIQNSTFEDNSITCCTTRGGGMYMKSCPDSIIDGNTFLSNREVTWGGGIYVEVCNGIIILNNLCSNNMASTGGGLYCERSSFATMIGNIFDGNESTSSGGGVYIQSLDNLICESNLFQNNMAGDNGGGMYEFSSESCRYEANTIHNNIANGDGGGLYIGGSDAIFVDNIIECNRANTSGGGIYFTPGAVNTRMLPPNSISSNVATVDGGGIYNDATGLDFSGSPELFNRLIDNTADGNGDAIANFVNGGANVQAANTCWGINDFGQIFGAIWDNFDDATLGEVVVNPFVTDCIVDCNGNGINDSSDICSGVSIDCNNNGIPDDCDIASGDSADCNSNAIPDECDIDSGFSQDADMNGVPDECVDFEGDTDEFWSTAANWQNEDVPGDEDPALVESPGIVTGDTLVRLDINVSVDSVLIRPDSTLDMSNVNDTGDLTIDAANGITNLGTVIIGEGRSLIATASTTLRGSQPFIFDGADSTLSSFLPTNTWTNEATIEGQGIINASIVNLGTLHANVLGAEFLVTGLGNKVNDGLFTATDGATLRILSSSITGAGQYVANNGTLVLDPTGGVANISGESMTLENGGHFQTINNATLNLTGELLIQSCSLFDSVGTGGSTTTLGSVEMSEGDDGNAGTFMIENEMSVLIEDNLRLTGPASQSAGGTQVAGGCSPPPVLHVLDDATVDINGDISMSGIVDISVQLDTLGGATPFTLAGNFDNFGTSPATFDWLNGPLRLDGSATPTFEVAGVDLGAIFDGYETNFAIGELEIAGTGSVTFRDIFYNMGDGQGACTEALYVRNLVLESGSTLTLSDVRIYYETLTDDGATINLVGCGELVEVTCVGNVADAEGDCDVDLADYSVYVDCVTGDQSADGFEPPSDECLIFDADGDGDIDLLDFEQLQAAFTGSK